MFRRPFVARRGAPLLRGALLGGTGFMPGRAATRASDRDADRTQPAGYVVPPRPAPADELADLLDRLAGLHADGVLTDEEFTDAKARLVRCGA